MKLTKLNTIFILLSAAIIGVGVDYYNILDYKIADALSNLSLSLFVVSCLLFFVRNEVFSSWLTFAKFWIPLTLVFIIISPSDGSGAFFPAFFSSELTSILMSGLFLVISLVLIVYKSFLFHKNEVDEKK